MKRVFIIGGGFAGISALRHFAKYRDICTITLIDRKETSDFLPIIPDVVGGSIANNHAALNLSKITKRYKACFIHDEVTSVDIRNKSVITSNSSLEYDYLLIACGTRTNFYGNENLKNNALKLDSVQDAVRIKNSLLSKKSRTIMVVGGGYTGIELITNAWLLCRHHDIRAEFILIERAPSVIAQLPDWMKEYVLNNLKSLGFVVKCNTGLEAVNKNSVKLSDGTEYEDVLLLWSAGVTFSEINFKPEIERKHQARLSVDEYLRINEYCFAAGDAAGFLQGGRELRMGIQFSLKEGQLAAENIVRRIKGKAFKRFRPVDLGYIVPMANKKGCGVALGRGLKGIFAIILHYIMCVYRTYGWRNKFGIVKDLIMKRV